MLCFTSFAAALLLGVASVLGAPEYYHDSLVSELPTTSLDTTHGFAKRANSAGCGKTPTLTSGVQSINVNGKNRQYTIRVPSGYDKSRPYKLIFAFHWVGGTMGDVSSGGSDGALWAYYGMQKKSNEGAILVAPQGLNNGWPNSGGEDIAFVDAMRNSIEANLCVDTTKRFATGFSYGGSMSFSIACSRAKDFRAVAVISGGQLSGCAGGNDPIAYLGIHGISDGTLNIAGGRALRDRFVKNNGCTSQSPREPAAGSKAHVTTKYSGCKSGYPVTWLAFDGGHAPAPVDGGGDSGARSYTPDEIWGFFNQF
ncbi:carbohydrate esterase family 1 protein [Curvularia clavata]|uniref:Feruloyl esterase C n=1 Tax=Curvularia clavata TaxID=95742 RepID=A0A9Q9DN28_CURCL|nr:carbohydrate esterase family 1 protein [Curvularia clavata]